MCLTYDSAFWRVSSLSTMSLLVKIVLTALKQSLSLLDLVINILYITCYQHDPQLPVAFGGPLVRAVLPNERWKF